MGPCRAARCALQLADAPLRRDWPGPGARGCQLQAASGPAGRRECRYSSEETQWGRLTLRTVGWSADLPSADTQHLSPVGRAPALLAWCSAVVLFAGALGGLQFGRPAASVRFGPNCDPRAASAQPCSGPRGFVGPHKSCARANSRQPYARA